MNEWSSLDLGRRAGLAPRPEAITSPSPEARAQRGPQGSTVARVVAAIAVIVCVAVGDYLTAADTSLILFYLAPIAYGTWFAGRGAGIALSGAGALTASAADGLHHLVGEGLVPYGVLAWNGVMQLGTSLALVVMLSALRSRLEGEEALARTDALTGIANRRAFLEAASLEIERARRHRRPLTIVYVDVDDFKNVNDRMGHVEGDALLVSVAQALRAGVRAVDAVARLGGDEFGLLLPETDPAETDALLARLRADLRARMQERWRVGVSVGVATFLSPPGSPDELMARADELMYGAKREEKGSIRLGVYGTLAPVPTTDTAAPR